MNRAKNRRINQNQANTLNFNIYPKVFKNVQKLNIASKIYTKCSDKTNTETNTNIYSRKYWVKEVQNCNQTLNPNTKPIPNRKFLNKNYKPSKIKRVYKDPKSQCGKNNGINDYNCYYRKRIQNRGGIINENYNYSSGNYLHRLKEKMKNEKLVKALIPQGKKTNNGKTHVLIKNTKYPNKHPDTNESLFRKTKINDSEISKCNKTNWITKSNKIKTAGNYTQKMAYKTSLIADIKKRFTPNTTPAMEYTDTYPKQNPYPCYTTRQKIYYKNYPKYKPIPGIPILGIYVQYLNSDSENNNKKGIITKLNTVNNEIFYNILLDGENNITLSNVARNQINILLDEQKEKEFDKKHCYRKECKPC